MRHSQSLSLTLLLLSLVLVSVVAQQNDAITIEDSVQYNGTSIATFLYRPPSHSSSTLMQLNITLDIISSHNLILLAERCAITRNGYPICQDQGPATCNIIVNSIECALMDDGVIFFEIVSNGGTTGLNYSLLVEQQEISVPSMPANSEVLNFASSEVRHYFFDVSDTESLYPLSLLVTLNETARMNQLPLFVAVGKGSIPNALCESGGICSSGCAAHFSCATSGGTDCLIGIGPECDVFLEGGGRYYVTVRSGASVSGDEGFSLVLTKRSVAPTATAITEFREEHSCLGGTQCFFTFDASEGEFYQLEADPITDSDSVELSFSTRGLGMWPTTSCLANSQFPHTFDVGDCLADSIAYLTVTPIKVSGTEFNFTLVSSVGAGIAREVGEFDVAYSAPEKKVEARDIPYVGGYGPTMVSLKLEGVTDRTRTRLDRGVLANEAQGCGANREDCREVSCEYRYLLCDFDLDSGDISVSYDARDAGSTVEVSLVDLQDLTSLGNNITVTNSFNGTFAPMGFELPNPTNSYRFLELSSETPIDFEIVSSTTRGCPRVERLRDVSTTETLDLNCISAEDVLLVTVPTPNGNQGVGTLDAFEFTMTLQEREVSAGGRDMSLELEITEGSQYYSYTHGDEALLLQVHSELPLDLTVVRDCQTVAGPSRILNNGGIHDVYFDDGAGDYVLIITPTATQVVNITITVGKDTCVDLSGNTDLDFCASHIGAVPSRYSDLGNIALQDSAAEFAYGQFYDLFQGECEETITEFVCKSTFLTCGAGGMGDELCYADCISALRDCPQNSCTEELCNQFTSCGGTTPNPPTSGPGVTPSSGGQQSVGSLTSPIATVFLSLFSVVAVVLA